MTSGSACVIENTAEAALSNGAGKTINPHWLRDNTAYPGVVCGMTTDTPPKPRVAICAPNPCALFEVALTTDGGSNGSESGGTITAPSYTYTVKDLNGNTLGTAMTPIWNRPLTILTGPATHGAAYYDQ